MSKFEIRSKIRYAISNKIDTAMKLFPYYYCLTCLVLWMLFSYFDPKGFATAFWPAIRVDSPRFFKWELIISMFLSLLISLAIELKVVGWKRSAIRKIFNPNASMIRDEITCLLFMFGLLDIAGYILTMGIPYIFGENLIIYFPVLSRLNFISYIDSHILRVAISVLLVDFFLYLSHVMMHRFNPLWLIHQYHHASTEMTIFSAHRNNPFSRPVRSIISAIPINFFGCSFDDYMAVAFIYNLLTFLVHSEMNQNWGWLGRWVFISPRIHKIHHSSDEGTERCNYGFAFVLWDRMFGTYNENHIVKGVGVSNSAYNRLPIINEMFLGVESIFRKSKRNIT